MSKPSLRQNILLRSVEQLLPPSENVRSVVMMSTRHRLFIPYALLSGVALFVVASVVGVEGLVSRLVVAGCGLAVAGMATTTYAVLAETTEGLVLCRSSRIRQYATAIDRRLDPDIELTMIGSTVITSDWRVDGTVYMLTKRWEATMRQLATART